MESTECRICGDLYASEPARNLVGRPRRTVSDPYIAVVGGASHGPRGGSQRTDHREPRLETGARVDSRKGTGGQDPRGQETTDAAQENDGIPTRGGNADCDESERRRGSLRNGDARDLLATTGTVGRATR